MTSLLLKIDNLIEGNVIKRPSKYIKTPYVADIIPFNSDLSLIIIIQFIFKIYLIIFFL